MQLGLAIFWLAFSGCVAAYAAKKGRSAAGFFAFSLLLSPLLGFLFAAFTRDLSAPASSGSMRAATPLWPAVLALLCSVAAVGSVAYYSQIHLSRRAVETQTGDAAFAVREICTAADSYRLKFARYPDSLAPLGSAGIGLISDELATGKAAGYDFIYTPGAPVRGKILKFELVARPSDGASGRSFFADETAVIRFADGYDATKYSTPLGTRHP